MYVIGISSGIKHGHHDGAAVLLRDGKLIAAAEEERFTLAKHARGELPRGAIGFCLKQAGITMRDVNWICSPLKTYTNCTQRLTEYFRYQFGHSTKIELYDHHLCHAASSFYGSGFSEATVACFDFSGDSSCGLVAHARGNDFRVLTRFGRNNSLGLYYGMLTQYLGYQMTNDEYKVMGLSSYGSPDYLDKFAKLLRPTGINYELDPELDKRRRDAEIFSSDFSTRQERIFTEKMEEILVPRRLRGAPLDQRFTNIAASGQKQLEIVTTEVIRYRAHPECPSRLKSALQPIDRRVREGDLAAGPDQHQPQHQRAADGERASGGAAHLFLLRSGRAVSRALPTVEGALGKWDRSGGAQRTDDAVRPLRSGLLAKSA